MSNAEWTIFRAAEVPRTSYLITRAISLRFVITTVPAKVQVSTNKYFFLPKVLQKKKYYLPLQPLFVIRSERLGILRKPDKLRQL
jgi:hypothetical protein